MTYRKVSPYLLLASHWPSRSHPHHAGGSPSTPALLLLGLTKLLVIKRLILLVVRLDERVISPIGKVDAISIAEVAIDRRHLALPLDVRLLGHLIVIEQDIHHKRPIGSAARCIGHPLGRVNLDHLGHLGGRACRFLIQCPRSCHPLKFIDQFFLSHLASFPSTLVLAPWERPASRSWFQPVRGCYPS